MVKHKPLSRRSLLWGSIIGSVSLSACGDAAEGTKRNASALRVSKTEGRIDIFSGDQLITSLHYEDKWPKPFLYPLTSASGQVISRAYPLETREGESTDHAWHRGIWFGHGIVNDEDFWRELGPEKSGRLNLTGEPEASTDGNSALLKFSTVMEGREPAKKVYGHIDQGYEIAKTGEQIVIDARITVKADAGMELKFGDTDDGGFGFRLRDEYREDRGAQLINSEQQSGSKAMWGKQARWVDYSTKFDGNSIGFAMFDHPSNLRYPTGWHARGYALCSANPFAAGSFAEDKSIDGSYTLTSGEQFTQRYRVIIHEGEFLPADVDAWFATWAASR